MSKISTRRQIDQLISNQAVARASELLSTYALANPSDVEFYHRCAAEIFRGPHIEDSRQLYKRLIDHNPLDADAHFGYSRVVHYQSDNETLPALQQASDHVNRMSVAHKIKLAYTLGKANQDLKRYSDAYSAFSAGARMHFRSFPFDRSSHLAMLSDIRHTLTAEYLQALPSIDPINDYPTPVFILGMPRSGSTLIEQILASHPNVSAAGEVDYLKQAVQEALIQNRQTIGGSVEYWDEKSMTACAEAYLQRLARHSTSDSCRFVTDKMPGNFAFVGLIAKLFPNALVIHTSRHPLACVWSNYSTLFGDGLRYTYDLDALCEYYQAYRLTMEHWQQTNATSFEVGYEDLIANTESLVRKLLTSLELEWDDNCLQFFRNDRKVMTASVAQVRKPIYNTSLHTWQQYTDWLRPAALKYELVQEL